MSKTNVFSYILTIFIFSFLFFACQKSSPSAGKLPTAIYSYVYAYTSGVISKADPVRIRFVESAVTAGQLGEPVAEDLLSLSPSVAGRTIWEDERTLLFQPDNWLNSNQEYTVTVNLKKIIPDVPKSDKQFKFSFRTKDQFINLNFSGLNTPNPQDLTKQELKGTLYTADVARQEEVERTVEALQAGRSLPIRWEHSGDLQNHHFVVSEIARGEEQSNVEVSWNGKPLNSQVSKERNFEIPSLSDFKVLTADVVQSQERYVSVNFSDPLLPDQEVSGLIEFADYQGNYRFLIDGNELRIYPSQRIVGPHKVLISAGIKNVNNYQLQSPGEWFVEFSDVKPQVRLVGNGVVLPNGEGLLFPFEAIGLNAVEVEIFKIYNNNILQFLQINNLDGGYELQQVGKIIAQKKVVLNALNESATSYRWNRYALSLDDLIEQDRNAFYQIRIGFRPPYATFSCPDASNRGPDDNLRVAEDEHNQDDEMISILDSWYGIEGYYSDYKWEHREDPCFPAYYNSERFVSRNVIASNFGLIAKQGTDNSYFVTVSDLRTTSPVAGATIEFYDYQQQLLQTTTTNNRGFASADDLEDTPFFVIARQGNEKGYLRLHDGASLSLSKFNVSGAATQKGLKGFLYGERGVWRPGDSVYLHFVLEDRTRQLPANYPINFELFDPRGQLQATRVTTENVKNIYPLHFKTKTEDPTGNWVAKVKAGGATFSQVLKIETVKPNRLKINLDFGSETLTKAQSPLSGNVQVNWLHGAPAQNLRTVVEVSLRSSNTTFEGLQAFEFDDRTRSVSSEPSVIFDGKVNENGAASFSTELVKTQTVPGKLTATFKTRAFEKGGDFSTDNFSIPYHPFSVYAGLNLPEDKYGTNRIDVDKSGTIKLVTVDDEGQPVSNRRLSIGLYRSDWRWWWDRGYDNISRFNSSNHHNALQRQEVTTDQKGQAEWNVEVQQWGRYLVRVCDTQSGHCSGDFFYAGTPWDDSESIDREAASMLAFTADQDEYQVGEKVKLTIPTGKLGRALVSIENGTRVVESFWVDAKEGENVFSFETTAEMTPTVYAHVALIQPHDQAENDLPIRLYCVIPIDVTDPETKIQPTIKMPEVLRPEEQVTIEVGENKGLPMAYTLAIVDEGLLGLTRFQTPNPRDAFYAREALGVKTWDVYDQVLGAYGGNLERLLSIGGDAELNREAAEEQANRFKPVVLHLGPFELKRGQKAKHTVKLPNYVGAVRTMVVAADQGAYGSAEKSTPVKKPLMVLATLPRMLGPGESLKLPVTVFAMDRKVRNVSVRVEEASGLAEIVGPTTRQVTFNRIGEQVIYFDVQVNDRIGIASFEIVANGNGESATQEIELQVRNPNPYVTDVIAQVIEAGASWSTQFQPVGMPGTNTAILEMSNIPPINLGERLKYLMRYPYGCLEQTISGSFPQLYLAKLVDLDEKQEQRIPQNIIAAIERLSLFQTAKGGFAFWPGQTMPNHWATNYAGHFLLEAKALGYSIPPALLNGWIDFQRYTAKVWHRRMDEYGFYSRQSHELAQAYRLYTLALANKPDMAAMNRLRETKDLTLQAKWRLAAAYALVAKPEVARNLVAGQATDVQAYQELSGTFGSRLRDRAMILETLLLLKDEVRSAELVKYISEELSGSRWHGTQTVAYSLMAVGKYVGEGKIEKQYSFAYQLGQGQKINAGTQSPVFQIDLDIDNNQARHLQIDNPTGNVLFARLLLEGQPIAGQETAASNDLRMEVTYRTANGQTLDPGTIVQGVDFIAQVKVTHPGLRPIPYREMALSQIFPSGWEIINSRMDGFGSFSGGNRPEYQDFRDDRVDTFFDIFEKKTQTYYLRLNAAYQGRFYLPAVSCQAMYDNSIYARTQGRWVEVIAPGES